MFVRLAPPSCHHLFGRCSLFVVPDFSRSLSSVSFDLRSEEDEQVEEEEQEEEDEQVEEEEQEEKDEQVEEDEQEEEDKQVEEEHDEEGECETAVDEDSSSSTSEQDERPMDTKKRKKAVEKGKKVST
ncbi:KNR4/SMI1-like protein 2-like [Cucumis melo var. makuwa]|uniref:KNR4/SMI1-like protein 2-like n=1 Tax=Cucumis melo var. makuwa TaxID=1194695 RepID=A0A5D3BUE9_CUCMM|nr:KNR4/SMI1-like protein 2-like [Cucumis melo var. makuwa]